jgi:hypothetical protein
MAEPELVAQVVLAKAELALVVPEEVQPQAQ